VEACKYLSESTTDANAVLHVTCWTIDMLKDGIN